MSFEKTDSSDKCCAGLFCYQMWQKELPMYNICQNSKLKGYIIMTFFKTIPGDGSEMLTEKIRKLIEERIYYSKIETLNNESDYRSVTH